MAQLSILEYARYFDLTRDYTENDINDHISNFHSKTHVCQGSTSNRPILDSYPELLHVFEQAAKQYVSAFHDAPLPLSDHTQQFQICKPLSNSTRFQSLQALAQASRGRQNLKLLLPLLKVGGGNVEKDVKKIRRGIDLNRALQEVAENFQDPASEDEESATETDAWKQALHFVREQSHQAPLLEPCEITVSRLHFLKEAITDTLVGQQASRAVVDTLPCRFTRLILRDRHLSEEDFDIQGEHEMPLGSSDTAACQLDQNTGCINGQTESQWPLPCTFGEKNAVSSTPRSDATNLSALSIWEKFTNIDMCDNSAYYGQGPRFVSRHKLPEDVLLLPIQNSAEFGTSFTTVFDGPNNGLDIQISGVPSSPVLLQADSSAKVSLPAVNANCFKLPTLDIDRLLVHTAGALESVGEDRFDLASFCITLPFSIPDLKDVIHDEKSPTSATLEKYFNKANHIISSSEMLYRDPGTRMLQRMMEDEEDLELEDYLIDEQNGILSRIASPRKCVESESDLVAKSNDVQKTDSAVSILVPSDKSNASRPLGTESSLTDGKHGHHGYDARPTSRSAIKQCAAFQSTLKLPVLHRSVLGKRRRDADSMMKYDNKFSSNIQIHNAGPCPARSDASSGSVDHRGFESDSITSFLQSRGKQFRNPVTTITGKAAELMDDPIQGTQSEQCAKDLEMDGSNSPCIVEPGALNLPLPTWSSLAQQRTIVINNSLLQSKQNLVCYLEQTEPEMLCLLYRDLDVQQLGGADLVLNASTCVLITSPQALDQRSLPGQKSTTGLSKAHDSILKLAHMYSHILVLVHYLDSTEVSVQAKRITTLTEFLSFCQKCSTYKGQFRCRVSPIWLPCEKVASTADVVNAWVWQLIRNYGHRSNDTQNLEAATLLQEETLWEMFLRAIGINPLAAQLMLGLLRKNSAGAGTWSGHENDAPWGIRRLVSMSSAQRFNLFEHILSKHTLDEMNRLLEQSAT